MRWRMIRTMPQRISQPSLMSHEMKLRKNDRLCNLFRSGRPIRIRKIALTEFTLRTGCSGNPVWFDGIGKSSKSISAKLMFLNRMNPGIGSGHPDCGDGANTSTFFLKQSESERVHPCMRGFCFGGPMIRPMLCENQARRGCSGFE